MTKLMELLNLENQGATIKIENILIALITAAICGLLIYFVYRFFYRGVVYSENFGILIMLMCVVTAFIILTIGANLVLSLGMVGALSIVRFRAAVKDPLDVGFLYWAVAVGLTAGAGLPLVALAGSGATALLYIGMTFLRKEKRSYLLILHFSAEAETRVTAQMAPLRYKLKNRTRNGKRVELTVEVKLKNGDITPIQALTNSGDIEDSSLVEFVGDYT